MKIDGLSEELKTKLLNAIPDELKAELKDISLVVNNNGEWLPKNKLNDVIEQKNQYKTTVEQLQKELKEAGKNSSAETQRQLEELTNKFNSQIQEQETKFKQFQNKTTALDVLRKHKAEYPDLLLNKLDLENMDGLEDQIKSLKNGEYKKLFQEEVTTGQKPIEGQKPPINYLEELQNKPNKTMNDFANLLNNIKK